MLTSPRRRSSSFTPAFLLALFFLSWGAHAYAEESIFDPENPNAAPDPKPSGEESIFDPENAATETPEPPLPPLPEGYTQGTWRSWLGVDLLRDQDGEAIYQWDNSLTLRSRTSLTRDTSAVLEGSIFHSTLVPLKYGNDHGLPGRWDDVATPYALYRVELGDAYLSTRTGDVLWRIGQQRVVWGHTDLTRPADILNPLDLRNGFATSSGSLQPTAPILMLKGDYTGDWGALQGILIPFFEPHRTQTLGGDFALSGNNPLWSAFPLTSLLQKIDPSLYEALNQAIVGTALPEQTPNNASLALRYSTHRFGADWSLGYAYAWDRTPVLRLNPDLEKLLTLTLGPKGALAGGFDLQRLLGSPNSAEILQLFDTLSGQKKEALLSATYQRWHVLTAGTTAYLGPIGVRADLALTPQRTFLTQEFRSIRRPSSNAALGLSYEGDEGEIALILEGFWLHVFDSPTGPETPLFFEKDFYGITPAFRINLEHWTEIDLTAQLGGIVDLRRFDTVFSPQLAWRLEESTRLYLSAQIFAEGQKKRHERSAISLYNHNDQIQFGLEQGF